MKTKDIKLHISNLCQRYNIDPLFLHAHHKKMASNISDNRISCEISNPHNIDFRKSRYVVLYIEEYEWYVVWNTIPIHSVYSVSLRDAEAARAKGTTCVIKNCQYPGWGTEVVQILNELEFEDFIKNIEIAET
ncbi:MAG: hypothetical protein IKC26_01295 [Clostridia bacterium]|nr:hypothetical protein [Clostridia bacterium]